MKLSVNRKRVAVSELMGTLIMVSITLVAGAAVFGWVNGQAGTSESAYGVSVSKNVNFLNERFVEVTQTFTGTGGGGACAGGTSPNFQCTGANFWTYNNGQVGFTLYTLQIKNLTNIPSGAANPAPLNIRFYSVCSVSSSTCGFVAYNKAGTSTLCSNTAVLPTLNGFYQTGPAIPAVLAQGQLSPNPYQITMPTGGTCGAGAQYLYDGITYTFTFTGLYGNTFTTTVTVNG